MKMTYLLSISRSSAVFSFRFQRYRCSSSILFPELPEPTIQKMENNRNLKCFRYKMERMNQSFMHSGSVLRLSGRTENKFNRNSISIWTKHCIQFLFSPEFFRHITANESPFVHVIVQVRETGATSPTRRMFLLNQCNLAMWICECVNNKCFGKVTCHHWPPWTVRYLYDGHWTAIRITHWRPSNKYIRLSSSFRPQSIYSLHFNYDVARLASVYFGLITLRNTKYDRRDSKKNPVFPFEFSRQSLN